MQKGANPNLRIPNHDMESASESPIELLLRYYLKLIEVFGVPGSGHCRTSYRPNSFEETELAIPHQIHDVVSTSRRAEDNNRRIRARDLHLLRLREVGSKEKGGVHFRVSLPRRQRLKLMLNSDNLFFFF